MNFNTHRTQTTTTLLLSNNFWRHLPTTNLAIHSNNTQSFYLCLPFHHSLLLLIKFCWNLFLFWVLVNELWKLFNFMSHLFRSLSSNVFTFWINFKQEWVIINLILHHEKTVIRRRCRKRKEEKNSLNLHFEIDLIKHTIILETFYLKDHACLSFVPRFHTQLSFFNLNLNLS
jgi:hypothetical protein